MNFTTLKTNRRLIFIILGITAIVALAVFVYNKYYKPAPELTPKQRAEIEHQQEIQRQAEELKNLRAQYNYQSPIQEEIDKQVIELKDLRQQSNYQPSTTTTEEIQNQLDELRKLRATQQ